MDRSAYLHVKQEYENRSPRLDKVLERWSFLMTNYVGIDIAKYFHVATVIHSTGKKNSGPFKFDNSREGFDLLVTKLELLEKSELVIGIESTAHYHQNLLHFFISNNYAVELINPLLTKRFRGINIRDVKNDNVDSESIALFMLFNSKDDYNFHSTYLDDLNHLCKERADFKKKHTRSKIRLTATLDKVFPELKPCIGSTLITRGFLTLLSEISTANEFANTRIDRIYNLVNKDRNFFSLARVEEIKSLAKKSIGFHNESLSLTVKLIVNEIFHYGNAITLLENKIIEIMEKMNSPIMKLPGMGYIQAASILSVIGDIDRFDKPNQLVAYAGLDPKVRQSGQFTANTTRMSKRGNALLRSAAVWSAHNMTRNSLTMNEFYQMKRNQNKSHYNALGHCAKKLLHYIFYILKNPDKEFVIY